MEDNTCQFAPGIHAVEIVSIKKARDYKNQAIENTIRVGYRGADGKTASEIITYAKNTVWIVDELIKACKLSNKDKEIPVTELIGKRIWIYVKGYYNINDMEIINELAPQLTEVISGKYSQFFGPKPSHADDPDMNNGTPQGIFVEFTDFENVDNGINLEDRDFGDD